MAKTDMAKLMRNDRGKLGRCIGAGLQRIHETAGDENPAIGRGKPVEHFNLVNPHGQRFEAKLALEHGAMCQ